MRGVSGKAEGKTGGVSGRPTRLQQGCLAAIAAVAIVLAIYVFVVPLFYLPVDLHVAQQGTVHATELTYDWDLVCVATPYCVTIAGAPQSMEKVCRNVGDDSAYGLGFFRGDALTHAEYFSRPYPGEVRFSRSCFSRDEDPVIVKEDGNLVVRPTKG
jgi:hypothetical protein